MNDVPREELISALLDGELDADERRQAEQLLADDPGCRQFYEELLLVRAAVAGLPRYKLDRDMSRRVLRRAERKMLLGQTGDSHDASFVEPLATAEATWRRDWRTVLWPALAVAAALLLIVLNPGVWSPPDDPQVANNGAIAEKAPATGNRAGNATAKAESAPSIAEAADQPPSVSSAAQQPSQTFVRAAPGRTSTAEIVSDRPRETPSSASHDAAPKAAPRMTTEIQYILAEVAPEVLRQSGFHELLQSHDIALAEEPAPRRAPVRFGGPLATPSARTAIEEANRNAAGPREAAYLITATREQIDWTIAVLRGQAETYTVVEEQSFSVSIDQAEQTKQKVTVPEGQSPAVARRFANRGEAEAAARQLLRGASSDKAAAAELVTAIVVLRSPLPKPSSTDAIPLPDESPERGCD